ncbi:hypothetical protein T440DRAFT_554234 [Plenodomus tracheiphilus IPT5]|uniref:Uncharacterized protein n=1 Tax=Plenodomus tracheiphilus IPT5 TaxID=1408161 RepID=A0A6A7B8E5_9PLEO|nr:hypothetical protein T440DRAFT_554234 [Plenodomus tracheiphilus IPT5]
MANRGCQESNSGYKWGIRRNGAGGGEGAGVLWRKEVWQRDVAKLALEKVHIRPLDDTIDQEKLCIVLATPSFAPKLLDDDFMSKLIHRIYASALGQNRGSLPDLRIDALCAVVDKVPVGHSITARGNLYTQGAKRSKALPVAPAGYEGFAYVSLPAAHSVPSNLSLPSASSNPGAIDFITSAPPEDQTNHEVLRLPLANTVFQTGTPTTMFSFRYAPTDGPKLDKVSKTKISYHQVRINANPTGPATKKHLSGLVNSLFIPLLPLTEPRRVNGCMGNIIRRIIGPDGEEVTASSELEDVVPKFFKARGEPAQATTAWALIMPSSHENIMLTQTRHWIAPHSDKIPAGGWENLWRSNPPVWRPVIPDALARGARLHRVLSGGGGWGQKAGLLSIDPVPVTDSSRSSSTGETQDMLTDPENFASTLTPVVNEGDLIQFFIQPASSLSAKATYYDGAEPLKSIRRAGAVGWELGTIPSTVDSIPGRSWQHAEPKSTEASIFRRTFGALTEGPLVLTKRILNKRSSTTSMTTTTIDVPFTRFWKVDIEDPDKLKLDTSNVPGYSGTGEVEKSAIRDQHLFPLQMPRRSKRTTPHEANRMSAEFKSRHAQDMDDESGSFQVPLRRISAKLEHAKVIRLVVSATIADPPTNKAEQSSLAYKALKAKHRSLHRQSIRLTDEYNATIQSLIQKGIIPPEQVPVKPQRRLNYRILNARFVTLQQSISEMTKSYNAILKHLHQKPHPHPVAFPPPHTPNKAKTPTYSDTNPPLIRKIKRKTPYTPSTIIQQSIILANQLARLATFARALLFRMHGPRGITPVLRHRKQTIFGHRAGRRMWRGLGVKIRASISINTRPDARDAGVKGRVRRIMVGRVRRVTAGRRKSVVGGERKQINISKVRGGARSKSEAGVRVRRLYVGRDVRKRVVRSPRTTTNRQRSEVKRREGKKRLEELARSWLM